MIGLPSDNNFRFRHPGKCLIIEMEARAEKREQAREATLGFKQISRLCMRLTILIV